MSNHITKQLQKATTHVRLEVDDKLGMREHVLEYMEYMPLRSVVTVSAKARVSRAPLWSLFRSHHFSGALAIALIVTTTTASVSSAASDALPGDLLYSVKVNVNEEIKAALITSDEGSIAYERERAEMRLEEASKLAVEGRLDNEARDIVAKKFAEHTDAVVEQVRDAVSVDPVLAAEASSDFAETLDTHEALLARLMVEQGEEVDDGARAFVEQVHAAAKEAEEVQEEVESHLAFLAPTEAISISDGADGDAHAVAHLPIELGDVVHEVEAPRAVESYQKDSANLRVRAVYRAQERAQEQYVHAVEAVAGVSANPRLVEDAQKQILIADARMEQGAQALAQDNLSGAYAAYRDVSAVLRRVVQVVEVAGIFDVDIAAGVLKDYGVEDVSTGTSSVEVTSDTDLFTKGTIEKYTETTNMIAAARVLLLAGNEYDEDTLDRANDLIKDASANMLRADIYTALEEDNDARILVRDALAYAREAVEVLEAVKQEQAGEVETEWPAEDVPEVDEQGSVPVLNIGSTTTNTEKLSIEHAYVNGVYVFQGTLVATSCGELSATLTIVDTRPKSLSLALTTTPTSTDAVACDRGDDVKVFEATITGAEGMLLSDVTLDGTSVTWTPVEFGSSSVFSMGNTPTNTDRSFFRRALENTQHWVNRE